MAVHLCCMFWWQFIPVVCSDGSSSLLYVLMAVHPCCMFWWQFISVVCSDGSSSLLYVLMAVHPCCMFWWQFIPVVFSTFNSTIHSQLWIYCTCSCFCAANKQLCLFAACVMLLYPLSHDCAITLCIKSIGMSVSLLFISHVNVYELLDYRHYCIMKLQDTVQCMPLNYVTTILKLRISTFHDWLW